MPGLRRLDWTQVPGSRSMDEYCVACQDKLEPGEVSGVDMSGNDVPCPEFRFRTRTAVRWRKLGEKLGFGAKDST